MTHEYSPVKVLTYPVNRLHWDSSDEGSAPNGMTYKITARPEAKLGPWTLTFYQHYELAKGNISEVLSDIYEFEIQDVPYGNGFIIFYCNTLDWTFNAQFTPDGRELLSRIFTIESRVYPLKLYGPGV